MIETAMKIRELFNKAQGNIDLPGFWRFPTGACEGATLFLGNILKELFPESEITYVKGYKPSGSMHFWLDVDGFIYDITADQFPEIEAPIFGGETQPLEAIFSRLEKTAIEVAFLKSDVTTPAYKNSMMVELRYFLTGHVNPIN